MQRIYTNLLWILSKCSTTKGYSETPASEPTSLYPFLISVLLSPPKSVLHFLHLLRHGWDTTRYRCSFRGHSCLQWWAFHPTMLLSTLSLMGGKITIKCCIAHCISFPLVFSLRLTVLFTYHFKSSKLAPLHPTTQTGRQSESVPLNLLNIELTSELIHVLPHATQPRPQGLIVLSIHCPRRHVTIVCWVPVCLLDGGVCWHVPDDLILLRLSLNVLRAVFIYRWVVNVALSRASERNEGLVCLAAVFACYSKAAEAVEISKFLLNGKKKYVSVTYF